MHGKRAEHKKLNGVDPYLAPKNTKRIHELSVSVFCFSAASAISELLEKQSKDPEQSPTTGKLCSLFNTHSNKQYRRRDNVKIFGVKEEADGEVYRKIVDVAMKVGHQISIQNTAYVAGYLMPKLEQR